MHLRILRASRVRTWLQLSIPDPPCTPRGARTYNLEKRECARGRSGNPWQTRGILLGFPLRRLHCSQFPSRNISSPLAQKRVETVALLQCLMHRHGRRSASGCWRRHLCCRISQQPLNLLDMRISRRRHQEFAFPPRRHQKSSRQRSLLFCK